MFINIKNNTIKSEDIISIKSLRVDDCYNIKINLTSKFFPLNIYTRIYEEYLEIVSDIERAIESKVYKLEKFTDTYADKVQNLCDWLNERRQS